MNAIGPETFHGQHRGTGTGLQYTCNRVAGVVVSPFSFFSFLFSPFIMCFFLPAFPHTHEWKLMLTFFFLLLFRELLLRYTRTCRRRFLFI